MIPENFHFLRPLWLVALLPAAALVLCALRRGARTSPWRRFVDEHLLRHLVLDGEAGTRRWPLWALAGAWATACVALAGPAWERLPQPLYTSADPVVVALDLSRSMERTDLEPSRRMRARYELQDVLERVRGGQVGLVLFSDEPFVAVPLTDDGRVVAEMIPSLTRDLMPRDGDRADRAIDEAVALLEQGGAGDGRILLLTDGLGGETERTAEAAARAAASGHAVSVLAVAPRAAIDGDALRAVASAGGGSFAVAAVDDRDLDRVLPPRAASAPGQAAAFAGADEWRDAGAWLVLVPALLAPLAFRRGWLVVAALWLALAPVRRAEASLWDDLWQRPDQQGAAALAAGQSDEAAELFETPGWRAASLYEAGRFAEAAAAYDELRGADNEYNRGNALARAGDLRGALAAYDEALREAPQHEDARFNRELVERLLAEQEKRREDSAPSQPGQGDESRGDSGGDGASADGDSADGGATPGSEQSDAADAGEASGGGSSAAEGSAAAEPNAAAGSDAAQAGEAEPQPGTEHAAASAGQPGASSPEENDPASEPDQTPRGGGAHPDRADPARSATEQAGAERAPDPADSLAERVDQALAQPAGEKADDEAARDRAAAGPGVGSAISEEEQAREQRLRQVPDDPGGLLRARIHRHYAEKRYAERGGLPW